MQALALRNVRVRSTRWRCCAKRLLLGLRVRGAGLEAFLERILASGYLLIDREDFEADGGGPGS